MGAFPVDLGGWALSDGGAARSRLPAGARLEPGDVLWLARSAAAFARQFGFPPDFELPAWPGYANGGDEVLLFDAEDGLIDALVYGSAPDDQPGWRGASLQPYTVRGVFGSEG
ncbi:lamin tail domain-containing protein, partial [Arthrospira platensis SPKY1]|nr:lamin tail domain-containing protein [Arthrospira platensis SPKY1]